LRLPESVDPDKINAKFENGVLTVTMAKKPEAAPAAKKIAIGR
jgi:HSP20 family protein